MSFVSPSVGITKLSEMEVDADKPWEAYGITNLKELAASMQKGDILFMDGIRLAKSSPSSIGSILTTHDFGNDPTWTYPP